MFCKKSESLREHMQEHFSAGGKGVAKLIKGEVETYALESQARHFLENGRAELVKENPLEIAFTAE